MLNNLHVVTLAVAAIIASTAPTSAQQAETQQEPVWVTSSGVSWTLFPSGDIYPVYVADPHRPTNIIAESFTLGGGIPDSRSPLTRLGAGGRFGMLRIGPAQAGGRSWQFSIEAGLDAIFDSHYKLDVAGWDGNYGLTVTTASDSPVGLKFALLHTSAHLGDEYQDRTGRVRINYTREEFCFGVRWRWSPRWHAYGETGVAFRTGDSMLEPWRVQGGMEYESRASLWGQRFARYVAADVLVMQERDWRMDVTVDLGIVTRGGGRASRVFFQWHDGRPTVNEFFRDSESSISLGLRIDL